MNHIESNNKIITLAVFFLFFFLAFNPVLLAENPEILVINSNTFVEKYKEAQDEFKKAISHPVREINLGDKEVDADRILTRYNPDLIYCIGAKAYYLAARKFPENPIVFSSIINWLRLPLSSKAYGVSNELHPRMPCLMFRTVFPDIRKIGMLYSDQYTLQWFNNVNEQAKELKVEIVGRSVSHKSEVLPALKQLLSEVNALWLISDPLVMPEKEYFYKILKLCDANKIPVFSYHEAFAEVGVVLIISVDTPTIGRQAASIALELLSDEKISEKVQFPAGSHITLNMKQVKAYGLKYNKNALGMVNNIIK